ncbi:hypothetical protein TNCV_1310171 [Trichonephila clavipes]|nr:hypothetical protein TNCV_1310171 [Trichonephila clavipes]
MPYVNKIFDHPEILKQLALEVIDGIPLDAVKIYTDGGRGETNTTGSEVLIDRIFKIHRRNADHASVIRTELIAIMCGLSLINNIQDQAFSEIWILADRDPPSNIYRVGHLSATTPAGTFYIFLNSFQIGTLSFSCRPSGERSSR